MSVKTEANAGFSGRELSPSLRLTDVLGPVGDGEKISRKWGLQPEPSKSCIHSPSFLSEGVASHTYSGRSRGKPVAFAKECDHLAGCHLTSPDLSFFICKMGGED